MADLKQTAEEILNTEDVTGQFAEEDVNNQTNKILAALSYIPLLFLLPMFLSKDSKFAIFHANQGIILFVVDFVVGVIATIIGVVPLLGGIVAGIVGGVGGLCCLALAILGILNVFNGKAKKLPLIGNLFTVLK
jgi:uncharacterized membrane protein